MLSWFVFMKTTKIQWFERTPTKSLELVSQGLTIDELPWRERKRHRTWPTLELFKGQTWRNVWEWEITQTGQSMYGLCWACRCNLELKWTNGDDCWLCHQEPKKTWDKYCKAEAAYPFMCVVRKRKRGGVGWVGGQWWWQWQDKDSHSMLFKITVTTNPLAKI